MEGMRRGESKEEDMGHRLSISHCLSCEVEGWARGRLLSSGSAMTQSRSEESSKCVSLIVRMGEGKWGSGRGRRIRLIWSLTIFHQFDLEVDSPDENVCNCQLTNERCQKGKICRWDTAQTFVSFELRTLTGQVLAMIALQKWKDRGADKTSLTGHSWG